MSYATVADFIQEFGLVETSQLLADEESLVSADSLNAYINNEAIADSDVLAALEFATSRLESMLGETAKLMNGYIARTHKIPLSATVIGAAPIKTCNLELARCQLMEDADNFTELSEKRCQRWFNWLKDIATGKTILSAEPASAAASRPIRHGTSHSKYDWESYS